MLTSRVMNLNKTGFTLLEIIVVLVIISMFLGLGMPKVLESLAESDLSKSARELSLFIEQIRSDCIFKKKNSYILFDLPKKAISSPNLYREKSEKRLYIPPSIGLELIYQNKQILDEKVKIEISNFGYINPLTIYLKKNGIRKLTIEVEPFLLQNKITPYS